MRTRVATRLHPLMSRRPPEATSFGSDGPTGNVLHGPAGDQILFLSSLLPSKLPWWQMQMFGTFLCCC